MILASAIGSKTTIANWPSNDLEGLLDALKRWPLDKRCDLSDEPGHAGRPGVAPFRGQAWGDCVTQYDIALKKLLYIGTKPIYPEHPNAVRYSGNFIGYSFAFWLDTDDEGLIEQLDQAIADNLVAQANRSQ